MGRRHLTGSTSYQLLHWTCFEYISHDCELEDRFFPGKMAKFQFIAVQDPNDNDKATKRLARSHAVKQALQNKRKLQKASMQNFCIQDGKNSKRPRQKGQHDGPQASPLVILGAGTLDPFDSLPIKSSRLQHLLNNHQARQAPEPVFSISQDLDFQNFHSVFRAGLVDPALMNAVMLSLAFAASGGVLNNESLVYRGQAIHHIRETMNKTVSESTIGAILLLVGVEARLGTTSQVQLHMGAVQLLLKTCQRSGFRLTEGIKRAVFWQDLNSSILVGSKRIVDHMSFTELEWKRDSVRHLLQLPPGLRKRSHLFSDGFIEVLEDIYALERIRDDYRPADCVVTGANVSTMLLSELQQAYDDPVWEEHADLLLWLVYMGGAFSPTGHVRSGYIELLQSEIYGAAKSWVETYELLRDFIWSDVSFRTEVRRFWEEAYPEADRKLSSKPSGLAWQKVTKLLRFKGSKV
ncbi:uncharacterized protein FIESC28_01822 [Fusarium coffeatum]|uniref:Transcription factor domain-containing protein n=1 Tax=Fusarium coffeatum TaxID=231269 RepID=A0A366S9T6_9HYPO|nr:uncharacterized protein FIESC28_01822 [Fusarium coffeatum]RBR25385.1 hypothetical protein FIESC28_01822 [Fusarium coffeatum]